MGLINLGLFYQVFAGISVSMGTFCAGALYGWITVTLPHILSPESEIPMTPQEASWMIAMPGITNMLTPIPAGLLIDHIGRKPLILISAPLFGSGWIIIPWFKTYTSLLVARCFQGSAVGIVYTAIPVYLGEIASTKYRGAITSLFFIFSWSGYLFEYCTGPFLSFFNTTFLTFVTTVIYFGLVWIQPESPYYYLIKGDKQKAWKSLTYFRGSSEETVIHELEMMTVSVENDQARGHSWKEVFATSTDRKALYMVMFLGCLRVLSGTMVTISYVTETFKVTSHFANPEYITIVLGFVLVFGACCSFFTLDILGRRTLLISSALGSSISLFCAGSYYYLELETTIDVSSYSWLAPVAIMVFAGISVVGLYPVHTAYTSELFKSNTRAKASSISALLSTLCTFLTMKLYQTFIDLFGIYFNFFMFSAICFIGAIISYIFMPETKNKTFDQIRRELQTS